MGQLSVYIDDETLKKIEEAAKSQNVSVSKWITSRIRNSFNTNWDDNFFNLYGSITDDSFKIPDELSFNHDAKRESL